MLLIPYELSQSLRQNDNVFGLEVQVLTSCVMAAGKNVAFGWEALGLSSFFHYLLVV